MDEELKNVDIYYTKIKNSPIKFFEEYQLYLPEEIIERNKRFVRWQDRQANILGKLLLIEWLKNNDFDPFILKDIKYTKYGRPFLDIDIDFNISHSRDYVVCAFAKGFRVGIDIEEIRENDFKIFESVFTKSEYKSILESDNNLTMFYKFWTKKESIIKANGRGLSIPLREIDLYKNKHSLKLYDEDWYLFKIDFHDNYISHLSANKKNVNIEHNKINFYQNEKD